VILVININFIICTTWCFFKPIILYTYTIALLDASRHVVLDVNAENIKHLTMYRELNAKKKSRHEKRL